MLERIKFLREYGDLQKAHREYGKRLLALARKSEQLGFSSVEVVDRWIEMYPETILMDCKQFCERQFAYERDYPEREPMVSLDEAL